MTGFQSPNYTQTPNDLFDELLPQMGMAELKVVLCIVRHTFGYHRDEIKLSIRKIARFTGLNVNSVMEGATQAEEHGLIERDIDGNKTTTWRAVVSVLPTQTRRLNSSDASVLSTQTLLGVKEKKESKNNGGKSPLKTDELPIEWQIASGVKDVVLPDDTISRRLDFANLVGIGTSNPIIAREIAMAFQTARDITFPESKVKGQRKAIKEMLEMGVNGAHVTQATHQLIDKGMTVVDLFSVIKTAVDIANKPEEKIEYLRQL